MIISQVTVIWRKRNTPVFSIHRYLVNKIYSIELRFYKQCKISIGLTLFRTKYIVYTELTQERHCLEFSGLQMYTVYNLLRCLLSFTKFPYLILRGPRRLNVRVLDLRSQGRWCEIHLRHFIVSLRQVRKRTKSRNRYNLVPHLTQDTNGKVTNSQLDITNENQEVSPFPAGDHKASINRRARKYNKHKKEIT